MHELFLTSSIDGDACPNAIRILQAYCAMSPLPLLRRRLLWRGPSTRNAYKPLDSILLDQGPKAPLWRTLNQYLTVQAFVVTLIYDIKRDQFSNEKEEEADASSEGKPTFICDEIPGTLQWVDVPDTGAHPVNRRNAITMDGEKNLCNILQSINYGFILELVEEGYRFVHGNVVIYLTRILTIPQGAQDMVSEGVPKVNSVMPPYQNLSPFDGDNKWVMTAKLDVLNVKDQESMKRGLDELKAVKSDFEGLFNLQVKDRLLFDTKVRHS